MSAFLTNINYAKSSLESVATSLRLKADAYLMTGNEYMYEELTGLADSVLNSRDIIEKAVSNRIHEDFEQSQQATANMVNVALNSSKIT